MSAFEMHRHYGRQFGKLLRLIVSDVLPALPKDAPPGATSRVQVLVEDYFSGQLEPPEGKILPQTDAENEI